MSCGPFGRPTGQSFIFVKSASFGVTLFTSCLRAEHDGVNKAAFPPFMTDIHKCWIFGRFLMHFVSLLRRKNPWWGGVPFSSTTIREDFSFPDISYNEHWANEPPHVLFFSAIEFGLPSLLHLKFARQHFLYIHLACIRGLLARSRLSTWYPHRNLRLHLGHLLQWPTEPFTLVCLGFRGCGISMWALLAVVWMIPASGACWSKRC